VFREELLVVTSPQHPLARKKTVTPQDLARQPFVLFEAGSNSRRTIETFFMREQIAPKVVTETENVEIIKALVRIRMGISIVPYQAVAREVGAGQLAVARIAGHKLFRETGWVHLRSNRLPRAVQEMKRILEQVRPRLKLLPGTISSGSRFPVPGSRLPVPWFWERGAGNRTGNGEPGTWEPGTGNGLRDSLEPRDLAQHSRNAWGQSANSARISASDRS